MLHVIEFADNGHIKRENVWIECAAVIRQRILGSRVRRAPTPRLDNKQGADVGMFDTITVETGLPDGASNQVAFQTKDFGAALREFRITPQGILEMRDKVWHPFGHHGLVTFYDRDRVYTAKFSRGRLIGIRSGNPDA